jgi:hypothetical protein
MIEDEISYDPLTGSFSYKKAGHGRRKGSVGTINASGYVQLCVSYKRYSGQRLAWYLTYGVWPKNYIDHINCNPLDNKLSNLREATASQNQCNRKSKGYSYHKGSGKYQARIQVNGKTTYLGWYDTEQEARKSFEDAQEQYHGDFAYKT